MKTSELTGPALDWAVAKCVKPAHAMVRTHQDNRSNWHVTLHGESSNYAPSTDWSQGGPIIEREKISVIHMEGTQHWVARKFQPACDTTPKSEGPTSLIAAMRCYVASKLGDEVEIPEELI